MFSPGGNSAQDGSVTTSGAVLYPTRFWWPYGGRRVSLIGSFTRWSEHLPMTPSEGCPTLFQALYKLPQGYYEFKFHVDGEWKHDERQPHVEGSYGIVNIVTVPREDVPISAVLRPESLMSGMNMDVDPENFQRADLATSFLVYVFGNYLSHHIIHTPIEKVTVSGGALQDVIPRISEADVEVSRRRVSAFLSTHTAYDLLPDSGKVIMLDVNLPVKQAFHILYEQGIPVAPLWDSYRQQVIGMLSALDFILILRELGSHGSNLTEEELETHTISAWKEGKHLLNGQVDGHGRPLPRRLIHAGPYDSLKDVAVMIMQNEVATVPIIHSSVENLSCPQLLHLASLSGILKCICRHFRHSSSLPILQQPICMFPLGTWVPRIGESNGRPLAMLRPNASLSAALSLLVQARVSSLPIVDENDSLVDVYSRSDITALAKDRAYAQIRLDEMSIHQALQLGQDASSPLGFFNGQRCQMCLRTDSLLKVMKRLSNPGVRRLIIVEAGSKRVEGIVSLNDVFRFLLGYA